MLLCLRTLLGSNSHRSSLRALLLNLRTLLLNLRMLLLCLRTLLRHYCLRTLLWHYCLRTLSGPCQHGLWRRTARAAMVVTLR